MRQIRSLFALLALLLALLLTMVAPSMAQTTILSDNFTRSDTTAGSAGTTTGVGPASTVGGQNLTDVSGSTFHIVSNTLVGGTTSAQRYLTYANGTYTQGLLKYQWVYADGTRHTGAFARHISTGNEYQAVVADNSVSINKVVSGAVTSLATNTGWANYHFADVLQLEWTISAPSAGTTTLTVHVYDVTQSFYLSSATTITDSTSALQSPGQFGLVDFGPSSGSTPDTYKNIFYSTTDAPPALSAGGVSFSAVQPTTMTITAAAAAGGTSPYTYQFQRSLTSGTGYSNVGSASSSTVLNDTGLTASTTYWYRCVVTDSAGTPAVVTGAESSQTTAAAPVVATGYSLSLGAANGPTGTPVTITATLTPSGGTSSGVTVTVAQSGVSGSFGSGVNTISLSTGSPSGSVTFTPTASGTATFSGTNSGSLTDPGNATYTVNSGPVTIAVTDSNVIWSPYNWYSNGGGALSSNNVHASSTSCQTSNSGAYVKFAFTGTSIKVNVDPAPEAAANLGTTSPKLTYSIDGGAWTDVQLSNTLVAVISLTGLASGNHTIYVIYKSHVQTVDNWGSSGVDPSNTVRIVSFTLDAGASTIAAFGPVAKHSKNLFVSGDSITEGVSIGGAGNDLSYNDASLDYILYTGNALDCEVGVDAFGFLGWFHGGSGNVPRMYTSSDPANSYWTMYDASHSRLVGGKLAPIPDYWFVNLGQNDGPSLGSVAALVQGWWPTARAATNTATPIVELCPFSGLAASQITTGFNAYQSATPDSYAYLLNLGSLTASQLTSAGYTNDGVHPNSKGHSLAASLVVKGILSTAGGGTTSIIYGSTRYPRTR